MANRIVTACSGLMVLAALTLGCGASNTTLTPTNLVVTSMVPSVAPAGLSVDVRILGMGFRPGATVSVGVPATNVVVESATLITATVPAQPAGPPLDVVVTNLDSQSFRLAQGLTFVPSGPKAVIAAALEASQQGTPGQYGFAVKFTESAGVPATVTDLWLHFDSGWSGQCGWTAAELGQPRLPANGTLALGPLTCLYYPYGGDIYLDVDISLLDDNGYVTRIFLNAVVR